MTVPPPEREAFEREIKALIPDDGDLTKIAGFTQRKHSLVSKMFNPNSTEKHNPVYLFVVFLWAFDQLRDGLGDDVIAIINRERDKWYLQPVVRTDPAVLTNEVGQQYVEAIDRELKNVCLDLRIKEWDDVANAAKAKRDALIAERADQVIQSNYGGPRSYDTREQVKAVRNGRQ